VTTDKGEIHEYAGGAISERKGTGVPVFLKVAYLVIGLGCTAYLVHFKQGEIAHATRGALVRQFNLTSRSADALMYGIAVLVLVGLAGLVVFAFRRPHER
jgi:hypothetical protein